MLGPNEIFVIICKLLYKGAWSTKQNSVMQNKQNQHISLRTSK